MQLDVQWFIAALAENGSVTVEDACSLNDQLGGDPDLGTYAQSILDAMASGMEQTDVDALTGQIQELMDYAVNAAASGVPPEIFQATGEAPAEVQAETSAESGAAPIMEGLPSFEKDLSECSDEELQDFMIRLLLGLRQENASDLHLSAGAPPFIRRNLVNERLTQRKLTPVEAERLNKILVPPDVVEQFDKDMDASFALEFYGNRFRVALMVHKEGIAGSYRLVPGELKTLEELGFMEHDAHTIRRLLDYNNGLILVTGPLGAGKTTTLAAMVNILNENRQDHVITVEDPIEIVQKSRGCQITQRQIGSHTQSYRTALKGALREDPDIIVIGEMHDLETIENAITASETGHLVIGTLHTCDAANTLNRILDVFPPSQQAQIRAMVAGSLRGILCQKLIPGTDGKLTMAYEILMNTNAVSNNINEGKIHQLKAAMEIGSKQGMLTIDQCLFNRYQNGQVTYETALANMRDAAVLDQIKKYYAVEQAKKLSEEAAAAKKAGKK